MGKKSTPAEELGGWRLERTASGQVYASKEGKRYRYTGEGAAARNRNNCYLCPKCGGPIRYSAWLRFYCDACNSDWCYEIDLVPNLEGGMWKEMDSGVK